VGKGLAAAQLRRRGQAISLLIALVLTGLWPLCATAAGGTPVRAEVESPSRWAALYARLPLSFEVNQGQTDQQVKFLSRGSGYMLFLTGNEAVLALRKSGARGQQSAKTQNRSADNGGRTTDAVLRMRLVGANAEGRVTGLEELPGTSNYFIGNDPGKWHTNIPNYTQVQYANIYPGVDLVYYGTEGKLEYDFVIQPGADPRQIVLDIGAVGEPPRAQHDAPLRVDGNGDLVVTTGDGELRFHKPMVYQPLNARDVGAGLVPAQGHPQGVPLRMIDGKYALKGNRITFEVARYDKTKPLVIDPVLSYSTYLGGTGGDIANGIAVDGSGNAYITGMTGSVDFPTSLSAEQGTYAGGGDAFVVKLNATGSGIIYSTYLGGGGPDVGYSIAIDSSGNAYAAGSTSSTAFPTVNAFQPVYGGPGASQTGNTPQSNGFIAKLNPTGTALLYSSYLGGSTVVGAKPADSIRAVAVDGSGAAYVTGSAESTDFPTVNPLQIANNGASDAFVTKVSPSGSALVYSTYLGGSGADVGQAITVDAAGNAYLTGYTLSNNFPTQNASQSMSGGGSDAFVAQLDPAGASLVFSTYLGGSGQDRAFGIALDSKGSIYLAGDTSSTDFPVTANAFQSINNGQGDAFISKLAPGGGALVYSTFVGGAAQDQATAVAVDSAGNAYITGFTLSSTFPTRDPLQATLGISGASECSSGICPDAFVAELNASGAVVYSTYLGGSGTDSGQAIAVDSLGQAYVAGSTTSSNFPVIVGALQATFLGSSLNSNAFVARINRVDAPGLAITPQQLNFGNQALNITSNTQAATLINAGSASLTITSIEAGTNFTQTNNCGTLLPSGGGNCIIQVAFAPTSLGATTERITINDSAPGSPHHITVTGTGVVSSQGALTVSPASLTFPTQTVGATSPPEFVRLTNLISIGATGEFSETNNCGSLPSVLNVGASCTIAVTFTPTGTGNRTGSLSVSSNAGGQTVSLSGAGNPVFTLSANPRSTVIIIGTTTATFTITASAPSSFTSYISLACSGGTCTFNPTSVYAGQSSTMTVTGLSATTSSPLNLTVNGTSGQQTASVTSTVFLADFSLAVTPALATVSAGKSVRYTITVTPSNGFNQVVQLGVAGLPQATTATLNPPALALNGTTPATATVTLTTTVQSSLPRWLYPGGGIPPRLRALRPVPWVLCLAALALLAALAAFRAVPRPAGPMLAPARAAVCFLLFLAALQLSCNQTYYNPVTPAVTGTPYGTFTIAVSGILGNNHAVTHSTTMNLSVGP